MRQMRRKFGSPCREAQIYGEITFAIKPQQLRVVIERAIIAGVPFGWVTAELFPLSPEPERGRLRIVVV